MTIHKVLVADDEPLIRNFLYDTLKRKNMDIHLAANGKEAIELLKKENFDLILSDVKMPYKSGLEVLQFAKKHSPSTIVIIMTAFASVENAVLAMKSGAFNYLIKPFSPSTIETIIEKVNDHTKLIKENQYLRSLHTSIMIAESPQMKKIQKDIKKIAKSSASVFISGESGTGKEVLAHSIHYQSLKAQNSFIKINCAAISSSLIESEFFGHEKGSFTGAEKKKIGKFELADKGSLLLDEVTEIPISLQPKLLRAIQEEEFERVGGIHSIKVDIRFIATSNRNMTEAIKKNIFREDLYFRLNVLPVHIPPLRERKEDILPLAQYFIDQFSKKNHKQKKELSPFAKEKLLNHPWPGNVRELANIIERAIVLDLDDIIEEEHIFLSDKKKYNPNTLKLKEIEKKAILKTFKEQNYNKARTAEVLGINVKTLRNKLQSYKEHTQLTFQFDN